MAELLTSLWKPVFSASPPTLEFRRSDSVDSWPRPTGFWVATWWVEGDTYTRIELRASVCGKRDQRGRLRPWSWLAVLSLDQLTEKVGEGSCKSLREASSAILGLDLSESRKALLRSFYDRERASLVTRRDDGSPVATVFGEYSYDYLALPYGEYLVDRQGRRAGLRVFGWGYCMDVPPRKEGA